MKNSFLLAAAALILGAANAFAQAEMAGADALITLESAITGNMGLLIGFSIMVVGLLVATVGRSPKSGFIMMLGGVLFVFTPGIFNGVYQILYDVVSALSGGSPQQVRL